MASNDDVVLGIPQIQCPSCQQLLDCSRPQIHKFTKRQRRDQNRENCTVDGRYATISRQPDAEDVPSTAAEKNYLVVTCDNPRCEQYNKIKVMPIPRLAVASAKVDLSD